MTRMITSLAIAGLAAFLAACNTASVDPGPPVKTSIPRAVRLAGHLWSASNLNVDTFRNGDPIEHAQSVQAWQAANDAKRPAWAYYNNDSTTASTYGRLYNWYAVNDPRGLAPRDSYIPTEDEWIALIAERGDPSKAAIALRSVSDWMDNKNGTNTTQFNAKPAGFRYEAGRDDARGYNALWWTSTQQADGKAVAIDIDTDGDDVVRTRFASGFGLAVRVIQTAVTIGTQVWAAKNLDVTKFRNGDPIPEAQTEQQWADAAKNAKPAWCYLRGDATNGKKLGIIYNEYAVRDPRGIAPAGWRVPSKQDWQMLIEYAGGIWVAAGKLKSKDAWVGTGFFTPGGTDDYNFSAMPTGQRFDTGIWRNDDLSKAYLWTSTFDTYYGKPIAILMSSELSIIKFTSVEMESSYGCGVRLVRE